MNLLRLKGGNKGKGKKGRNNNNDNMPCIIESIARKAGAFKNYTPYEDVAHCPLAVEPGKVKAKSGHGKAIESKKIGQPFRDVLALYKPNREMDTILSGGIEYLEDEHEDSPHLWSPCVEDPKRGKLYHKSTISSIVNGYVQAEDLGMQLAFVSMCVLLNVFIFGPAKIG